MKKLILTTLLILIMLVPIWPDSSLSNFDDFAVMVRHKTRLKSQSNLPDSTLWDLCSESLIWTSVDAGGIEVTHRFETAANDAFYVLPDSLTSINRVTVITEDGETKSMKQWYPEFFDYFQLPALSSDSKDQSPVAYDYWSDTIQIMPQPVRTDTIKVKCFVEHPNADTADATDNILLRPGYALAALDYACHEALKSVGNYEEAAHWLASYEQKKKSLQARYARRMDVSPLGR